MQNNEENDLLNIDNTGEYKLPEQKEIVLDLQNNKIRDTKEFSPIELIYMTAKEKGIKIKEFPINEKGFIDSGCKTKGCYGRGYRGFAGEIPIPCDCLFDAANIQSDGVSINRSNVRRYNKIMQAENKNLKNAKMKELGLKPLGNDLYGKIKKGTKNEILKYKWAQHDKNWNFTRVYDTLKVPELEYVDDIAEYSISEEEQKRLMKKFINPHDSKIGEAVDTIHEITTELDTYNRPLNPFGQLDGEVL